MANEYDVIVLGAGPGGYTSAIRAAQLGLKTAIVEKQYWGGVCLNIGCIPTKALLHNAEIAHNYTHNAKDLGIIGEVQFDYSVAFKRSRRVSNRLTKGVQFLMKKNKIDSYEGTGTFQDANSMTVALNSGETETLQFKNCIIATGSHPRLLPDTQRSEHVITYEELIMSDSLPSSIIIAGAGALGVEFSYILNSYGVDVTIVEYLDRIVPLEDEEVSAELHKVFTKNGINIMTSTRCDAIEDTGSSAKMTVTTAEDKQEVLEAQLVLQAIGFAPNIKGYGLENTGVNLTERGAIDVDGSMRTNVPNIYAIGDVTAKLMLAHAAEKMGIIAAETIADVTTDTIDFAMVPRATYCQPQVASFGYTEAQAREMGYDINVAKFPFQANGKALGMNESVGFVKLISDRQYGELLGGHMIGANVSELLPELTLAQKTELTSYELAQNIHAHPTLSEAIKEAAHGLEGHMINL